MATSNEHENMSFGGRKFYDLEQSDCAVDGWVFGKNNKKKHKDGKVKSAQTSPEHLLKYVRENVIGHDVTFSGPFGHRRVIYCDYIASGRSLQFIEDYIAEEVLPHYGNTHTTTTVTALQSTLYRHEARDIVRNAVNASENDAVIFVGHGCTGAVHKLIHCLNFKKPPLVFVSPFEHHSNLLPWREIGSEVLYIAEDSNGRLDVYDLEKKLKMCRIIPDNSDRYILGCISAASNITGILTDVDVVAACLHKYNALACFDYASAGPYCEINMNPLATDDSQGLTYKDAVFISPHKFVGGPGTPGILVAKKHCFRNPVPYFGGGGSVFYVTANTHRYLQEVEMREEGGTPAIVESIRAGMVFQLKEAIGYENIMAKEHELTRRMFDHLKTCPNIVVLGSTNADRLPVLSFVIKHNKSKRLLHHNFICSVMNDVFGIQARGGCACAGPYAQKLLGMTEAVALEYENQLLEDQRLDRHHLRRYREYSEREILRPGFARLNIPYFMSDDEIAFVFGALTLMSEHAWKLLPQYIFNPETGEWRHKKNLVYKDRKWLGRISYKNGRMEYNKTDNTKSLALSLKECLKEAENVFAAASKKPVSNKCGEQTVFFGETGEKLRWFLLPAEAEKYLSGEVPASCQDFQMPFIPGALDGVTEAVTLATGLPLNYHICSCSGLQSYMINKDVRRDDENYRLEGCSLSKSGPFPICPIDEVDSLNGSATICNNENVCNISGKSSATESDGCENRGSNSTNCVSNNIGSFCKPKYGILEKGRTGIEDKLSVTTNTIGFNACSIELTNCELQNAGGGGGCPKTVEIGCKEDVMKVDNEKATTDVGTTSCEDIKRKKKVLRFHHPPKTIFAPAMKAIEEFSMITHGDRVLLCLSGGKDSLSMLHTIRQYQCLARSKGIDFEFGAMTVDPQSSAYNPRPLKDYLKVLEVPYFYEEQDIIQQAADLSICESICSFCSRMKRGRIYVCARREGYNVVALGQHLDDLAESFMMSVFHNGLLRTMKANYTVREGDLRVIRPLVYVREKDLRTFAEKVKLPVIPENCPACFEAPKERHRTKQLLAQQEILFPNLFSSILSAIKPLMAKNRTGLESQRNNQDDNDELF